MMAGLMFPTAPAHVDNDSPLAVYLVFDLDQVYTIGSDVKINILVYWEGEFHDPVNVNFVVNSRPISEIRRDVGRYEANFKIQQSDLDDGKAVGCTVFVNEGPSPAPWTVPVKSLDMDIVVKDYGDHFMSPGDAAEFEVRTSYGGRAVDPDSGTLFVYRTLQGSTIKSELTTRRVATGVFAGTLTTSALNRTYVWHLGCEAEYTTSGGVVYGFNREVVQVNLFPVWIKRAAISTTASTLEVHVWEKDRWPLPDSVEGYPLQGAFVQLDYKYRDEALAYQEKMVQGNTGPEGYVSLDLAHSDMRNGDIAIEVVGHVRVGTGITAHRQYFEFLLPVRDYPNIPDMTGFDVKLHNYYIPEWKTITTLGHTARYDGQPLVGQEIYVYIADDEFVYHSGSVITGPQGYFNVQLKTPVQPEGRGWWVIDKCAYSTEISGNWYLDTNWLYFGEANLYGEFNETHDEDVKLSVKNLKEHQVVQVTIDHPEADGTDEKAVVMWGLGDPWNYWWNQQWLYDLLWAPVRPHWNVWPSTYQHVNYVPAYYKEGAWHASFYFPGFLPDTWDVWVHGKIVFTDTLEVSSATLRELVPSDGRGWPDVAITTPATTGIQEGVLNISGVASDAEGLENVLIRVDGGNWLECSGLEDWFYEYDTTGLAYGTHLLEVMSFNGDHYSKIVPRTFWTDQRPTVIVENPEDGGHYHGNITMNGTAWDDLTLDTVQVQIDGGAWTDAYGTIQWEYLLDLTSMDSGDHTLAVKAVAGTKESDAARLVFVVDRPPEIKITDPPSGGEVMGTFHVKGTAADDLSLREIHLSIDGGEWFPADEDTDWSYALDTTTLEHGEHYVEAKAWDGYEWSDTAYANFFVDNPPTISSISLADGAVISGIHRTDGESKDDKHEDITVQVQIDGGDWVDAEGGAEWYYDIDTTGMENGEHTLRVRAYDGTHYSEEMAITFIVNEAPVVGEMSLGAGDTVGGTVTVTGGSTDDEGVEGAQVRVDGGDWVDVEVDEDGNWSHDLDTTDLVHGAHTLEVRVFDGTQWSDPTSVEFDVDQMPLVTILSPEAEAKYKKDFEFNGTASDDDQVMRVEFRIDEGEWETADGTQVWNYAIKIKDLKKGEHIVEARSYDGTQYSDVDSVTFTVQKEEGDDSPGFGVAFAGLALLGAVLIAGWKRR
jgi:hypothetical protein